MTFVLSKKQTPSYWDSVQFSAKTDDGDWADFGIDLKFKRWTAQEIEAHTAKLTTLEDKQGKLTLDQRVESALQYVEDWRVADDVGEPVPLTAENLKALFNLYPGAPGEIWSAYLKGRHGRKEKN